jgi:hypothetical protein
MRCICGDTRATFAEPHLTLAQPFIRVLAWFSHAASQFITPYFGDLGPCTAWGCSNSWCGMATRVAETPGVVFQIRLSTTCSNVRSRLMGMCFRAPLEKSLHHASINSGRLGQLHTIVSNPTHSSVAPPRLWQASLFSQTPFSLCPYPHLISSSPTFSPSRPRSTTLQTPFGNALPPSPDVGSTTTPSSLIAGAHSSSKVKANS